MTKSTGGEKTPVRNAGDNTSGTGAKDQTGDWEAAALRASKLSVKEVRQLIMQCSASEQSSPVQPPTLSSPISDSSPESFSSVSGGILTPGALSRMRTDFSTAFNDYQGAPWLLSTGTNADDTLYQHVMTLDVESALHSFVLDQTGSVVYCFEEGDRVLFKDFVRRHDSTPRPALPQWMQEDILRYSLAPGALREQLSCGWKHSGQNALPTTVDEREVDDFRLMLYRVILRLSSLYEKHGNKLPNSMSESWYAMKVWSIFFEVLEWGSEDLEFQPGEVCSNASSLRVVTDFLLLRNRMEAMARLIEDWSNTDVNGLKDMMSGSARSSTPPAHARTLSTPKNSPKRRRGGLY
ncbi:hypothetical protein BC939DRAFT_500460 [Gamsiella multidivaricata]|uniref:uncharacterized protein n=1 Tax=Gamsiella multidivaricata TaxID=101098 RepID=UPI00221E966E|nr:uncharacterized protein BC939DRAFT_500460 [Gamsiella multidivaricata]KAI7829014.1 hypothetical protein BC939DRAFT_500460 [Gamsiella multidivaricata]